MSKVAERIDICVGLGVDRVIQREVSRKLLSSASHLLQLFEDMDRPLRAPRNFSWRRHGRTWDHDPRHMPQHMVELWRKVRRNEQRGGAWIAIVDVPRYQTGVIVKISAYQDALVDWLVWSPLVSLKLKLGGHSGWLLDRQKFFPHQWLRRSSWFLTTELAATLQ